MSALDTGRLPCVVLDQNQAVLDVLYINKKGFNKSLENDSLWALHGGTGRLIPYNENAVLLRITERKNWVEAVIDIDVNGNGSGPVSAEEQPEHAPDTAAAKSTESGFLTGLAALIKARKAEMPEGSYTTHLFSSGNEKIRKKTGEEAIELLLARERREIIGESADLIYHLLVLLEDEGISFQEIIQELKTRHGS